MAWTTAARPAKVKCGWGREVEVEAGSPFAAKVQELAEEYNMGENYRVFLNGDEIESAATAPAEFGAGDAVSIQPYDKAGR